MTDGSWQPLRVVLTRGRLPRWTRRSPDIVIGPGFAATGPRRGERFRRTRVTHEPDLTSALFTDRRTGWEIDVTSGLNINGDHARRVDAHAGHHARSSREVGILAGTTGHRASVDAIETAVVIVRRIERAEHLTVDLEIRHLTDEMHGRIQIAGGDWGLYLAHDTEPVMARALLRPAAKLARVGGGASSDREFYIGARIGGRP